MNARRWLREVLFEDARRNQVSGRYAPQMPRFVPSLVLVLLGAAALGWLIFFGFEVLAGASGWPLHPHFDNSAPNSVGDAIRSTLTVLGVIGGVFAVVYAYRKQRIEEASGHRSDAEQLSKRYQDAAGQLGHEKAAVRLAGVYAMARLADEWKDHRQTCVNVLCAYLRLTPQVDDIDDIHVRTTILAVIRQRLLSDSGPDAWSGLEFDFRRARLSDVDFSGVNFHSTPRFTDSHFSGLCTFRGATFLGGVDFERSEIEGELNLAEVSIQSRVNLYGVRVVGKLILAPDDVIDRSHISLTRASLESKSWLDLVVSDRIAQRVSFELDHITMGEGCTVLLRRPPTARRPSLDARMPFLRARCWTVLGGKLRVDKYFLEGGSWEWSPWAVPKNDDDGSSLDFQPESIG
jgi:hypothetical protein